MRWKIDLSITKLDLILFNEDEIHNHMMILSELSIFGYIDVEYKSLYYVIDSNWNGMDDNMKMETPILTGCEY